MAERRQSALSEGSRRPKFEGRHVCLFFLTPAVAKASAVQVLKFARALFNIDNAAKHGTFAIHILLGSMSSDLAAQLPVLGPRAIEWAVGLSTAANAQGTALIPQLTQLARHVGVRHPERIRVCRVEQIPLPTDPELSQAAAQVGLAGSEMLGLTLGYVVFLRRGSESDPRLLSHEFRHVAQYEACGGIPQFLFTHLNHLVAFGYEDSPFEVDARAHEIHAA